MICAEVAKNAGIFDDNTYAVVVCEAAVTTSFAPVLLKIALQAGSTLLNKRAAMDICLGAGLG